MEQEEVEQALMCGVQTGVSSHHSAKPLVLTNYHISQTPLLCKVHLHDHTPTAEDSPAHLLLHPYVPALGSALSPLP